MGERFRVPVRWLFTPLVLCLLASPLSAEPLRLVREIDTDGAPGAPFPPGAGVQLQLGADGRATLSWAKGGRALPDASSLSFDRDASGAGRVYAIDPGAGELLMLRATERAVVSERRRIRELVGLDAAGIAVDAAGDRLFVLEASRGRIVVVDGLLRSARRRVTEIALPANPPPLRGLAFDPASGHLHALAPATGELLELGADGTLLAVRQFPEDASDVHAIAFGPSTDSTDDPALQSLFAAAPNESGGTTLELALDQLVLAAAPTVNATLVQTILTSNFSPPSPDPSGIELLGSNGPLLISDGEVEEMSIYRGVNLWEVNLSGTVASTSDTTFFSNEPTGAAVNPANGHVFISDDDGHAVYEVTPGSDGKVNRGDSVRKISVDNYGSIDCEGVAFGGGSLWIAAGSDAEVYRISPGKNGTFDGSGDDVVSHFDTKSLGLSDTEGIAYDTDGGNVYVAGPAEDNLVGHFSSTGQLLRWLNISVASPRNPAGLAYGPGPAGSTTRRLYLVTRGTDNNSDSKENDGKLFVFSVSPLGGGSGNTAPFVSAGNDLTVDLAASASLDGSVSDDGLPSGGTFTTTWTKVSGPGTVSFANANAIDTMATFSATGSYVVRLTANDSQLSTSDDATITVTSGGGGGGNTIDKRVAAGADDAEQGLSGSVDTGSSDLELVTDGSNVQTVGIRFSGLAIPPGAEIQSAWIQFQADETSNGDTTLTIQGEASDNAAPFTSGTNNVGARPRISAAVAWSPPAWNLVGEAGSAQQTPDLSLVVREIVSRGGWASGNALAFIITGSGNRVAESFDGGSPAALLHVVLGGSVGNLAPTVSAGPDRTITLGQTASLDGTVTDDGKLNPTPTTTWSRVSGAGSVGFANASAVDTTATFSQPGSYVLRLTAYDGQFTVQDDMSVNVTDPSVGGAVERRVAAGTDDAEERVVGGSMSLDSSDLELIADGSRTQWVGMRFLDLPIPRGATIQNAWIQFQADEVSTDPTTSLTIQGELSANPGTFTSATSNVSSRTRTGASVSWTPPAWNLEGEHDAPQRTPSLAAVVKQIVDQPSWSPGNAMVFVVSGTGTRTAESFEGTASGAPLLHVEYEP